MSSEVEELRRQLTDLEAETEALNQMSKNIDDLQDKLEANQNSRNKLRERLLSLGYKL